MKNLAKQLTLFFSAGSLGALANSLALWLFGALGLTAALGARISPALTPEWLYPRIVWGGLWGFLFPIPNLPARPLIKGLLLSLAPTVVQLFVVFPYKANQGMMGLNLGLTTPLFVILFNAIWGVAAAYWIKYLREVP
ncbi:hypothetical protein [Kamptonema formosum]|uniref:hypothetical protein n=1 Tax=Kamptonema formosum TaxID=331992 RepID=UPI000346542F|nr:hypothetical protein [Oscillatoria sp. PCC 10802]